MSTHVRQIDEAFDKPYRYTGGSGGSKSAAVLYKFFTTEKDEIVVPFEKLEWSDDEYSWIVAFNRDGSDGVTGGGDAMRIFATVIEILKDFIKKYNPPVVYPETYTQNLTDPRTDQPVSDLYLWDENTTSWTLQTD